MKITAIIQYQGLISRIDEMKRQDKALTDEEIGKRAGYERNTINLFLNGKKQNDRIAGAIAKALKIEW